MYLFQVLLDSEIRIRLISLENESRDSRNGAACGQDGFRVRVMKIFPGGFHYSLAGADVSPDRSFGHTRPMVNCDLPIRLPMC